MRHLRPFILPLAVLALLIFGVRPAGAAPASTNPSWHVVPSPNVAGRANYLTGVAAISAANIWAVGYLGYTTTSGERTLIEHFDGTKWTIVPSPNPNSQHNQLNAVVAVPGTNHLWAAGWQGLDNPSAGTYIQTLYEFFNGTKWTVVPSPVYPAARQIKALAATGANDVWAVGTSSNSNSEAGSNTFIEHWNGQSWKRVFSPNGDTAPHSDVLTSVTAGSPTDAWATGGSPAGAFLEHWNGLNWSLVPLSGNANVESIVAASPTNIWGVGVYWVTTGNTTLSEPLLAHFDGTSWTFSNGPNLAPASVGVTGIVIDKTSGQLWAVGSGSSAAQYAAPYALHGDGSIWSFAPNPVPVGTIGSGFEAVAPVSATDVWAVGLFNAGQGWQTLIEWYH